MDLRMSSSFSNYTVLKGYKSYKNLKAINLMQKYYETGNLENIEGATIAEKQFTYFKLVADTYYVYEQVNNLLAQSGFAEDRKNIQFFNVFTPD